MKSAIGSIGDNEENVDEGPCTEMINFSSRRLTAPRGEAPGSQPVSNSKLSSKKGAPSPSLYSGTAVRVGGGAVCVGGGWLVTKSATAGDELTLGVARGAHAAMLRQAAVERQKK